MNRRAQTDTAAPQAHPALAERCRQLLQRSESVLGGLDEAQRASFLSQSLEDVLTQVELLVNALADEKPTGDQAAGPVGLLRRLTRGLSLHESEAAGASTAGDLQLASAQYGLQGNSWTIPLAELIGFLAFSRKSGVLWVDGPEENFLLCLEQGSLVHATSSATPQGMRLGEVLVGFGYLTRPQLERFLAQEDHVGPDPSGQQLLDSGLISEAELREGLTYQVQQLFLRLSETEHAIFRFREGMRLEMTNPVHLNITQLLLEGARLQDEGSQDRPKKSPAEERSGGRAEVHSRAEWEQWNREVLSEISKIVDAGPHAEVVVLPEDKGELEEDGEGPSVDVGSEPISAAAAKAEGSAQRSASEDAPKASEVGGSGGANGGSVGEGAASGESNAERSAERSAEAAAERKKRERGKG